MPKRTVKVKIRRLNGEWLVIRAGYGFGGSRFHVTAYDSWHDALRSVQGIGLGGAGSHEKGTVYRWGEVKA